jgi:MGT family glycosyltransferase
LTHALLRPGLTRLVWRKLAEANPPPGQRIEAFRALALQRLLAADRWLRRTDDAASTTHFIQQFEPPSTASQSLPVLQGLPHQPTVYVSLGTVFNALYPEVFSTIIAGLRDEPLNLIVTVGEAIDPATFGPQPANVRIERFIPQDQLLPHVDLCINHSGYSTVMGALSFGVPLVLLPLSADQPVIAQMCILNKAAPDLPDEAWRISTSGLPIVRPASLTPPMIRSATTQVLGDPSYKSAARAVQDQLSVLPGLDTAIGLLERLGREAKPCHSDASAGL